MNRSQKQVAAALLEYLKDAPERFNLKERQFILECNTRYKHRRLLTHSGFEWLRLLARRHLHANHELVQKLKH